MADDKTPHPVDLYVGGRVRAARKLQGVSQEALADALGLTFQQVQKYERGANRISSSKLYEIAKFLGKPVSDFYPPLDLDDAGLSASTNLEVAAAEIGADVIQAFAKLQPSARRVVSSLIVEMGAA